MPINEHLLQVHDQQGIVFWGSYGTNPVDASRAFRLKSRYQNSDKVQVRVMCDCIYTRCGQAEI
jgi:hypothetical protein